MGGGERRGTTCFVFVLAGPRDQLVRNGRDARDLGNDGVPDRPRPWTDRLHGLPLLAGGRPAGRPEKNFGRLLRPVDQRTGAFEEASLGTGF